MLVQDLADVWEPWVIGDWKAWAVGRFSLNLDKSLGSCQVLNFVKSCTYHFWPVPPLEKLLLEDPEMVAEIPGVGADAEEAIGQRVWDVFGDVARMAASRTQISTFGTWFDVQVGSDVPLLSD